MNALMMANALMLLHLLYVLGVIIPVVLIIAGAWRHWSWIRNSWFRNIHLAMMGLPFTEAVIGIGCPVTAWEKALLERAGAESYEGSFTARALERLLYLEVSETTVTFLHVGFGLAIFALYFAVPPRSSSRFHQVCVSPPVKRYR